MTRPSLHEEISAILVENGNLWMTDSEIASLVNERGRYKKTERATVPDVREFQIRLRTLKRPQLFERDGHRVRLLQPDL